MWNMWNMNVCTYHHSSWITPSSLRYSGDLRKISNGVLGIILMNKRIGGNKNSIKYTKYHNFSSSTPGLYPDVNINSACHAVFLCVVLPKKLSAWCHSLKVSKHTSGLLNIQTEIKKNTLCWSPSQILVRTMPQNAIFFSYLLLRLDTRNKWNCLNL